MGGTFTLLLLLLLCSVVNRSPAAQRAPPVNDRHRPPPCPPLTVTAPGVVSIMLMQRSDRGKADQPSRAARATRKPAFDPPAKLRSRLEIAVLAVASVWRTSVGTAELCQCAHL